MILDFRESSNDPNQNIVFIGLQFCARDRTTFFPIGVHAHVDAEWDHNELSHGVDAKVFVYVPTLVVADHDNSIGYDGRQNLLDHQRQSRLKWAIIIVEDVAMICVHETTS